MSAASAVAARPPPRGAFGGADGGDRSLRGCYVRTPYGWGYCISDVSDSESEQLKVLLDWSLRGPGGTQKRVPCWIQRADVLERSLCAVGACVLTAYGTGVVLDFNPKDGVYVVQLWTPPGRSQNRAYLRAEAIKRVLPAAAGLAVETPFGRGVCRGFQAPPRSRRTRRADACAGAGAGDSAAVHGEGGGGDHCAAGAAAAAGAADAAAATAGKQRALEKEGGDAEEGGHLIVDLPWGRAFLHPSSAGLHCRVALVLPLIDRFLRRAADLFRLHSTSLGRIREALGALGLERLQKKLAASAGEAVEVASRLWADLEARDAKEVIGELRDLADPKVAAMLKAGVARLNSLASKASGFDGTWVGKEDGQPRCTIKDAIILWHWGEETELEIWGPDEVSTQLEGEDFTGTFAASRELRWTDGDVWVRAPSTSSADSTERQTCETETEGEVEGTTVAVSTLQRGLRDLRKIVDGEGLEGDVEEALSTLLGAASRDSEVKAIVEGVRQRREVLDELRGQVFDSKTGLVVQKASSRLREHLARFQDNDISPQLEKIHTRTSRFLTRLTTDRKMKDKALELFSAAQGRVSARLGGAADLEAWVLSIKDRILQRLASHQALLVDCLSGEGIGLAAADVQRLLASSWDPALLEAQLEESLVAALALSGLDVSGTELLHLFKTADLGAALPVMQRTYCGLLSALSDLEIEAPEPIVKLIEARAAGHAQDFSTWHDAIIQSLDDDKVVHGAEELLRKGEKVLENFHGFGSSKTVAQVIEHLETQDLERELLKKLRGLNAEELVSTADAAISDTEARELLVSRLKDTCLDFILKVLPAIRIEHLCGHDNGCDWEISDICFSDFSFRKENVHIVLGKPGSSDEDLVRVSAWDIGAHFQNLKVAVKQTHFPFIQAEGTADAHAERMSVSLAFRLEQALASPQETGAAPSHPRLAVSSRTVLMQSLELCVRESNYAMIVNALTFLFAETLKDYACSKISQHLDRHTTTLVEALNALILQSAPLFARFGWQLPACAPETDRIIETTSKDCREDVVLLDDNDLDFLDWADPGRTFAVRY